MPDGTPIGINGFMEDTGIYICAHIVGDYDERIGWARVGDESTIWFTRAIGDDGYDVLDDSNRRVAGWRGDVEGIHDFIALRSLFDDVYGEVSNARA
jgi:hypothetical protein